jgi:hypothetical protein
MQDQFDLWRELRSPVSPIPTATGQASPFRMASRCPGYMATGRLARNRHGGDYSREVGQHPATALAAPLDFITMSAPRPPSRLWFVDDPRLGRKEPITLTMLRATMRRAAVQPAIRIPLLQRRLTAAFRTAPLLLNWRLRRTAWPCMKRYIAIQLQTTEPLRLLR